MTNELIANLQNPALYEHAIQKFHVIETHLSWIILTGSFAYKIKKPLNLGFQDFTTLEKRQHYCELEVNLNKRLAPLLYLKVVKITGSSSHPEFEGSGPVIEYAIKMVEFSQEALLAKLATSHTLKRQHILDITEQLAHFHLTTSIAPSSLNFGEAADVYAPMQENFSVLFTLPASKPYMEKLNVLLEWTKKQYQQLLSFLNHRKLSGFIRACHGDLHLGNMVLYNFKVIIFDCIEFNESFRWIDTINDLAFLTMDLQAHQLITYKHLLVNQYCEITNDYLGMRLLSFYECYRALVRAKIISLQCNQIHDPLHIAKLQQELANLINIADYSTRSSNPTLYITVGVSGSGKSLFTEYWLKQTGALRLRSDIMRKKLYNNLSPNQLYQPEITKQLYEEMAQLAESLLNAGLSVIIDATCLKQWQRRLFSTLASKLGISFTIFTFEASIEVLKRRLILREDFRENISDANENVLLQQLKQYEPLTLEEQQWQREISSATIDELINTMLKEQSDA